MELMHRLFQRQAEKLINEALFDLLMMIGFYIRFSPLTGILIAITASMSYESCTEDTGFANCFGLFLVNITSLYFNYKLYEKLGIIDGRFPLVA